MFQNHVMKAKIKINGKKIIKIRLKNLIKNVHNWAIA